MVNAQDWLTKKYESKKAETTEIRFEKGAKLEEIEVTELKETLKIAGYSKLKKIFLDGAREITELEIVGCPIVEAIFVSDNQIAKIEGLENLAELRKLSFGGNKVKKINISKNTK